MGKPTDIIDNKLGFTHFAWWADWGETLREQLEKKNIQYEEAHISHLIGIHSEANLIFYVSPAINKPMTVLIISEQYEIDGFAERYYYFAGMTKEQALQDENWWVENYDEFVRLEKCQKQS